MKLITSTPQGFTSHNMTDSELAALVRYEFPNLTGTLEFLLDRFEGQRNPVANTTPTAGMFCPKCGTVLELETDE